MFHLISKKAKAGFMYLGMSIAIFSCTSKEDEPKDSYVKQTNSSCSCDSSWFPHSKTPAPLEGKGSPFDTNSTTNCIFHQWSWQKFLWLTKPNSDGHPLFLDSLIQVDAQLDTIAPIDGLKLVLEDTAQAGSGATLRTNPGFNKDHLPFTVYYSIYADHKLLSASKAFKAAIGKDTALVNNTMMFPDGSLELKVSWVETQALPMDEKNNYYVTRAIIKKGNNTFNAEVALLGMHVVGKVINHPEFIWATFEHNDMAPYYDWASTTDTSDSPIVSDLDKLLFAKGNTSTLGGITWGNNQAVIPNKVYTLYKFGVPRVPKNAFMAGLSQDGALNYGNIENINNCVKAQLNDIWNHYFYNGSIWINTDGLNPEQQAQLIDSLGGNIGDGLTGSPARGSLNAFNITMETYVQTGANDSTNNIHSIDANDLTNCMSCHTGKATITLNGSKKRGSKSPLYVSHLFRNYLSKDSKTKLSAAKQRGIVDFVENKALKATKR